MGMMRRRARRRGLVRATVGTAAVVGTAGAVRHHQAKKWAKEDQQAYAEQQQYAPEPEPEYYDEPAPAPAAAADPGLADQLQQLAQLHESGVLNDEEFAAAKQKLLGG